MRRFARDEAVALRPLAGTPPFFSAKARPVRIAAVTEVSAAQTPPMLLRPLAEYEAAIGGGF